MIAGVGVAEGAVVGFEVGGGVDVDVGGGVYVDVGGGVYVAVGVAEGVTTDPMTMDTSLDSLLEIEGTWLLNAVTAK